MKKIFPKFVILLIILIALMILFKDLLIRGLFQTAIKKITGLELSLGKLNLNLSKGDIKIENLNLYNSPQFSDRLMLEVPEIYVYSDLMALLKKHVYLHELRLHLSQLYVIKSSDGRLNIDSLKSLSREGGGEMPQLKIDRFVLVVGKVIYKDYSKVPGPLVKEFNINIDEEFTGIDSAQTLVRLIIVKAITKTSIERLAEFNLDLIRDPLASMGILGSAGGVATRTLETLKNTAESLTDKLKKTLGR